MRNIKFLKKKQVKLDLKKIKNIADCQQIPYSKFFKKTKYFMMIIHIRNIIQKLKIPRMCEGTKV